MRKLAALVVLALSVAAVATSRESPTAPNDDRDEIYQTVQHYFDGMMQAKPEILRMAFHPEARLIGVGRDGKAMIIPFERWAASWEGRDPRDVAKYENTIVSADIAGTAASVKTDLVWPDVHYVDYLSLLKLDGEWKIVNKIWWEEGN